LRNKQRTRGFLGGTWRGGRPRLAGSRDHGWRHSAPYLHHRPHHPHAPRPSQSSPSRIAFDAIILTGFRPLYKRGPWFIFNLGRITKSRLKCSIPSRQIRSVPPRCTELSQITHFYHFKTRYCVKWRASEGKLVLKITDDVQVRILNQSVPFILQPTNKNQCIKFKTTSTLFLNRFEALNHSLMQKMINRKPPPPPPTSIPASAIPSGGDQTATDTPLTPGSGPSAAGGIKKKKNKKKK
jgi:signal recognition particle subunit SRP9